MKAILSYKSTKYLLLVFIVLLSVKGLSLIYFNVTDGFHPTHIEAYFSQRDNWEIHSSQLPKKEVKKILSQNFYWAGKGAQFYAFVSADGKTILKIVKQKHLQLPEWEKAMLSLPGLEDYRKERESKKQRKTEELLSSLKIAFEELQKESALLYHHLKPTNTLHITTRIHDKLGYFYDLDMDKKEFILQKRATPLASALDTAIKNNNLEEGKKKIDQMIRLLRQRSAKGVYDSDKRLIENIGFLDDHAIFIDIGSFTKKFNYPIHEELVIRTLALKQYFSHYSPELETYLDEAHIEESR